MALLGRPKAGDITRAQLRIKESKEFKVSEWCHRLSWLFVSASSVGNPSKRTMQTDNWLSQTRVCAAIPIRDISLSNGGECDCATPLTLHGQWSSSEALLISHQHWLAKANRRHPPDETVLPPAIVPMAFVFSWTFCWKNKKDEIDPKRCLKLIRRTRSTNWYSERTRRCSSAPRRGRSNSSRRSPWAPVRNRLPAVPLTRHSCYWYRSSETRTSFMSRLFLIVLKIKTLANSASTKMSSVNRTNTPLIHLVPTYLIYI